MQVTVLFVQMKSEVEIELFLIKYCEENFAFDQEISQETKRISFLISASVMHFQFAGYWRGKLRMDVAVDAVGDIDGCCCVLIHTGG